MAKVTNKKTGRQITFTGGVTATGTWTASSSSSTSSSAVTWWRRWSVASSSHLRYFSSIAFFLSFSLSYARVTAEQVVVFRIYLVLLRPGPIIHYYLASIYYLKNLPATSTSLLHTPHTQQFYYNTPNSLKLTYFRFFRKNNMLARIFGEISDFYH